MSSKLLFDADSDGSEYHQDPNANGSQCQSDGDGANDNGYVDIGKLLDIDENPGAKNINTNTNTNKSRNTNRNSNKYATNTNTYANTNTNNYGSGSGSGHHSNSNSARNTHRQSAKTADAETFNLIHDLENLSIVDNVNNKRTHSHHSNNNNINYLNNNAHANTNTNTNTNTTHKIQLKTKPNPKTQTTKKTKKMKKKKSNVIRITKSKRIFAKKHKFLEVLVKPVVDGSGCWLYVSQWQHKKAVTKLMPLFGNAEFDEEENIDNALREFEYHSDLYRKAVKQYGYGLGGNGPKTKTKTAVANAGDGLQPICEIYACVQITHADDGHPYLALVLQKYDCNLYQFWRMYRKLAMPEIYLLIKTCLRFLDLVHRNEIIHNDIKPENIFLNFDDGYDDDDEDDSEHYDDGDDENFDKIKITQFVFSDFGCSVSVNEEFPFGNLTGTLTMWDLEALGGKYGQENGFSYANDVFACIGTVFDAFAGYSVIETTLENENKYWAKLGWAPYTNLVRKCRKMITSEKFIKVKVLNNENYNNSRRLMQFFLELAKKRKHRMDLEQLMELFQLEQ